MKHDRPVPTFQFFDQLTGGGRDTDALRVFDEYVVQKKPSALVL
jgi:hypothetical protein